MVSAWRGETDWYGNTRAQPALEIRTGRLRFTPEQRLLTPAESFREMDLYLRHHPVAARMLPWLFGIDLRGSRDGARQQIEDFFRGVSFSPRVTNVTQHRDVKQGPRSA